MVIVIAHVRRPANNREWKMDERKYKKHNRENSIKNHVKLITIKIYSLYWWWIVNCLGKRTNERTKKFVAFHSLHTHSVRNSNPKKRKYLTGLRSNVLFPRKIYLINEKKNSRTEKVEYQYIKGRNDKKIYTNLWTLHWTASMENQMALNNFRLMDWGCRRSSQRHLPSRVLFMVYASALIINYNNITYLCHFSFALDCMVFVCG